jgi:hypothetical protein
MEEREDKDDLTLYSSNLLQDSNMTHIEQGGPVSRQTRTNLAHTT